MPNIASAKKRARTSAKRQAINHSRITRIRGFLRKVEEAIASGDAKAAGTGLVGGFELGAGMGLAEAGQSLLQGVQIIADGAVEADLPAGIGVGEGNRDGVFVDIKSEVEFTLMHGVVVSSHSHEESERIPRRVRGRSCGSAHPGNPRSNERQPHRRKQPFNARPAVAGQP